MLSPSRLNDFLGCEYRTWLDLAVHRGDTPVEKFTRPDADILFARGLRHEDEFLQELRAAGRDVVSLDPDDGASTVAHQTEHAMRAGRDAIHQACFMHDGWVGYADFLVRIDTPSALGPWSYEVHDAKLARHPKPNYIFQLLFYTEQVERLQGLRPRRMHLILGDGERPPFRPEEFDAYAAQVRAHFLARREELVAGAQPAYPYPVADCDFCPYWRHCKDLRRADDHLSLVASLSRPQGLEIEAEDVHSVPQVAALPDDAKIPGLAPGTLAGLRQQAHLQLQSRGLPIPLHALTEAPTYGRGLARLPDPSQGDVFFDFEGDPYWGEEGLEYLFGSVYRDDAGEWSYWPLWAHSQRDERRAFEQWMDWITERLHDHPDLHVFHYNHYEPTTIKKLMSRYATREHEVDELLRRKVFVDLYTVVRQSMRVGTESYGLKAIEALYAFKRSPAMDGGMGAARGYEAWIESQDPAELDRIALYNHDDCRSTLALFEWLQGQRDAAEEQFQTKIAALGPEPERELTEEQRAWQEKLDALRRDLTAGAPEDESLWTEDERTRQRMADLLGYHSREAKPQWWAYFARLGMSPEQLCEEDSEAIGGLELAREVPKRDFKRSWDYPLRFPSQQWKLSAGDQLIDPETGAGVNVVEIDEEESLVWVRRGKARDDEPLPRAVAPGGPYNTRTQQKALVALAERIRDHGLAVSDARVDLLAAGPPRFRDGAPALTAGPVDLGTLGEQVAALDSSALFIQGPPGAGKTYTGGRLAVELMRRGRRIGVTATSHKAICKLLEEIDAAADEAGEAFRGLQKCEVASDAAVRSDRIDVVEENDALADADSDVQLLAGTAWLWAREAMRDSVDVLFIDEAGQVSLADALAVAQAARNVVLLGDPQQLAHVSQGTHPRASGVSILEHLLGGADTVPSDRGVFLDRTWRMHPTVCRFVSDTMYASRLEPIDGLDGQSVTSPGLAGSGLRMLAVEHTDNRQSAPEEADRIATEVARLLDRGRWTDRHGAEHPLTLDDILVVAPYNAQVRCLRAKLPPGARVGTVDKFQGQEAPIVFFSMSSSSGEDVPRGMDFLFSRNRLNVAVSRAQALAVVVCSPRLLWTRCATVEQMRLVNMLCRFEVAAGAGLAGMGTGH
jgi:predicted RecB family nuclease